MGKHETLYPRVERDHYPTPSWVVDALDEHVDFVGKVVWECAAGTGQMAEALKAAGAAKVCSNDLVERSYPLDAVFDFLLDPGLPRCDLIATNPPLGPGGKLAAAFVARGLERLSDGQSLALLLPADFDSGVTRPEFFHDCRAFVGKIVLTQRVVWFRRADGIKEAPRENTARFLWSRDALRVHPILYAPRVKETAII
jgi:hypothetical protein